MLFGDSADKPWAMALGPIKMTSPSLPVGTILYIEKSMLPELVQRENVHILPVARFLVNGRTVSELSGKDVTLSNIHQHIDKMHEAAHGND